MKRVFKYPLKLTDSQVVKMPRPAQLLSVIEQDGDLVLYAVVDDAMNCVTETIHIFIRGTGNPMGDAEDVY